MNLNGKILAALAALVTEGKSEELALENDDDAARTNGNSNSNMVAVARRRAAQLRRDEGLEALTMVVADLDDFKAQRRAELKRTIRSYQESIEHCKTALDQLAAAEAALEQRNNPFPLLQLHAGWFSIPGLTREEIQALCKL